ncbi:MAG: hypothetical protein JWO21_483 [Solirubrobacterales bacterium]|jgi:hypothetical protein|nr:hypothetical protein [Solirubrobacterales bacterium]
MTDYTDEQLADLISALPPAPAAWVQSAQELPAARLAIDALVERASEAAEQRSVILADLEASLRNAGVEPRRELVDELRARLIEGP